MARGVEDPTWQVPYWRRQDQDHKSFFQTIAENYFPEEIKHIIYIGCKHGLLKSTLPDRML